MGSMDGWKTSPHSSEAHVLGDVDVARDCDDPSRGRLAGARCPCPSAACLRRGSGLGWRRSWVLNSAWLEFPEAAPGVTIGPRLGHWWQPVGVKQPSRLEEGAEGDALPGVTPAKRLGHRLGHLAEYRTRIPAVSSSGHPGGGVLDPRRRQGCPLAEPVWSGGSLR